MLMIYVIIIRDICILVYLYIDILVYWYIDILIYWYIDIRLLVCHVKIKHHDLKY